MTDHTPTTDEAREAALEAVYADARAYLATNPEEKIRAAWREAHIRHLRAEQATIAYRTQLVSDGWNQR